MTRDALLETFANRGLLLSPEALSYLENEVYKKTEEDGIREILASIDSPGIVGIDRVKELFDRSVNGRNMPEPPEPEPEGAESLIKSPIQSPVSGSVRAEVMEPDVLRDVTGMSRATARVDSFVSTFRDRYRRIRGIFRGDIRIGSLSDIGKLGNLVGREISVVGMVTEFHDTAKGTVALLEDPTGSARIFFRRELLPDKLMQDEVIAVKGRVVSTGGRKNGISMFADEIFWPDIPVHEPNRSDIPVSAAFISDVHIGSNTFLRNEWEEFLDWLGSDDPDAMKIGYLVMAGDVVDGIGIYPGQEKELEIPDIYRQYEALAEYVEQIPERIKVIISPGNHDFVRPAEPQPALDEDLRRFFKREVSFVGNPASVELSGVNVLIYHGTSITDFISNLHGVSYEDPSKALKRMLRSRILAPVYGGSTPLAPEEEDYMVIDEVPDIFVTGHVHSYVRFVYRGVLVINASTWQSQTEYQKMNNFKPEPGVVTVVELDTGRTIEKRFHE